MCRGGGYGVVSNILNTHQKSFCFQRRDYNDAFVRVLVFLGCSAPRPHPVAPPPLSPSSGSPGQQHLSHLQPITNQLSLKAGPGVPPAPDSSSLCQLLVCLSVLISCVFCFSGGLPERAGLQLSQLFCVFPHPGSFLFAFLYFVFGFSSLSSF